MKKFWQDYSFLNTIDKSKKIILYGRSEDWIPKFLRKIKFKPYAICDGDKSLDGTNFYDIPVIHSKKILKKKDSNNFFIITSGSYTSIINELEKKGYEPGIDFICSPDFKDFAYLDSIRGMSGNILFSSSDYTVEQRATRHSPRGGGLYNLKFSETNVEIKKIIDGSFRQICKFRHNIVSICNDGNIYILNDKCEVIDKLNLKMTNLCGIDFIEEKNTFILSSQTKDIIYFIDSKSGKITDQIKFSKLSGEHKKSYHHINDLVYFEENIYITFFSYIGSWKEGIFDGGIAKININTKKVDLIYNNNLQPHSPAIIDGEIAYVDSGNQKLLLGTHKKELVFSGFIRGLKEFKSFIFLGQSENMYISRLLRLGKLIDITPGIFMIDYNNNSKRFLPALGVSNIHDIYPLELNKK